MLNTERPRNSFVPTDELDWEASKPTAKRSPVVDYDNRKDRKSHSLLPVSDGNEPLPLDNSLGLLTEEVALQGGGSRCSRQSPVVSMLPSVARKAAPPIPKKPALLRHPQPASRHPQGGQSVFGDEAEKAFPPTPRPRRNRQQEKMGQRATESSGPSPSPISIGALVPVSNALMDNEVDGANAIPSLQPVRRRQ